MRYNFDEEIDRRNSGAVKTDLLGVMWQRRDLLPLWVADMDFRTPQPVLSAIKKRCEHEILGYSLPNRQWKSSIIKWQKTRHDWSVEANQISFVPGVVPALALAVNCFSDKGDRIMVQTPVYHPFFDVVEKHGRTLVQNSLLFEDGQFRVDFDKFAEQIKDCSMLLFCSPHNPGGRVWDAETIRRVAEICKENNVVVVVDEIHADLTLPGFCHKPFASVSGAAKDICVTLCSPSKTFNMPALSNAYVIVQNDLLRKKMFDFIEKFSLHYGNVFAFEATVAVYTECEEWRRQMLAYVNGNIDFVCDFIEKNVHGIKPVRPQASFLVFLDCRGLGIPHEQIVRLFVDGAGLALNSGTDFGENGAGFMRLNVATPRAVLQKALESLKLAVEKL